MIHIKKITIIIVFMIIGSKIFCIEKKPLDPNRLTIEEAEQLIELSRKDSPIVFSKKGLEELVHCVNKEFNLYDGNDSECSLTIIKGISANLIMSETPNGCTTKFKSYKEKIDYESKVYYVPKIYNSIYNIAKNSNLIIDTDHLFHYILRQFTTTIYYLLCDHLVERIKLL